MRLCAAERERVYPAHPRLRRPERADSALDDIRCAFLICRFTIMWNFGNHNLAVGYTSDSEVWAI
jgi:hypothetical protein